MVEFILVKYRIDLTHNKDFNKLMFNNKECKCLVRDLLR